MAFGYSTLSESSFSPTSEQAFEAPLSYNSEPSVLSSVQPKIIHSPPQSDQNCIEVRSINKQAAASTTNALNPSQQGKLHTVLQKMTRKRSRQTEQELKTGVDKKSQNGRENMAMRCVSSYSSLCSGSQPHLMERKASLSLDNVLLDTAANENTSSNNCSTGAIMV